MNSGMIKNSIPLQSILGILMLLTIQHAMAQESVQTVTLNIGDYQFTPDTIEVTAGYPVILTLINHDSITPHDFILDDMASGLNIDINISAGKTANVEFTPNIPGSYTFYCSKKLPFMKSHREKGMQGILIVK